MGTSCSREASTKAAGTAQQPQQRSECPISPQARSSAVYNVYNQRIDAPDSPTSSGRPWGKNSGLIDPSNNMPLEPHQQPIPGQRCLISTHREQSTIPKGGTDGTWLYPSPQMFFSALRRKGKGDDVEEADMESVVFAHNVLNEETWQRVAAWEKLHACECGNPSLLRFTGRPHNLSVGAQPAGSHVELLGGPLPFDRHDWYVDRCGKEVRYVIDFYFDDAKAGTPEAFEVVVRPGLDSLESALDRVKMSVYVACAAYGLPCPITGHSNTVAVAAEGSSSGSAASAVAQPE